MVQGLLNDTAVYRLSQLLRAAGFYGLLLALVEPASRLTRLPSSPPYLLVFSLSPTSSLYALPAFAFVTVTQRGF